MSTSAPPEIAALSPTLGSPLGGDRVTITGSGLAAVTSVSFGGQPATGLQVASDAGLSVLSPLGAGIVDVTVLSPAGTATAPAAFGYAPTVAVDVVRPEDLLLLGVAFGNGALQAGTPPQVVAANPTQPLFVVVTLPSQHVGEIDIDDGTPGPTGPIAAALGGPSRLVFSVPVDQTGVPLALDSLLGWERWTLVAPAASQSDPQGLETALELPYRLIVSPLSGAGFRHSLSPATLAGASELWHTDLVTGPASGTLVIAFSPDLVSGAPAGAVDTTPGPDQRIELARAGQATVRRLTLSGLGAWAEFQYGVDVDPTAGSVSASPPAGPLKFWHQLIGQGRNQLVKIDTTPGWLYPYGFRGVEIDRTERRPVTAPNGRTTEMLVTTRMLAATKTEIDFGTAGLPDGGLGLPFTHARLRTTTVSLSASLPTGTTAIPQSGGRDALFNVVLTDLAGREIDVVAPLLFAPDGVTLTGSETIPTAQLPGGDPVTFVPPSMLPPQPPAGAPAPATGSTVLPTTAMTFTLSAAAGASGTSLVPSTAAPDATGAPFVPSMSAATVEVPAISQLLGSAGASGAATIAFEQSFLGGTPIGQVFAKFVPDLTEPQTSAPLPLSIPADHAGGFAAPNMVLGGLSSTLGPVAHGLVDGTFDPTAVFDPTAKLLGGITLSDVLDSVSAVAGSFDQSKLPVLDHQRTATMLQTTFDWSPALKLGEPGSLLELGPDSALELHGLTQTAIEDPGAATFTLDGTLTDFSLNFLGGTVTATLGELAFHAEGGHKVDLHIGRSPTNPSSPAFKLAFGHELAFVNELADLLPGGGFADPPFLTVTADGVSAGYTLAVPSAGVGIVSLENLAITAALDLPFDGPSGVRLAFSERYHPFLATVSLIAGGGYLAIEVGSAGVRRVEGSLELGANLTVDLLIVSANVHVLAGFFFSYSTQADATHVQFDGYLRIGGSVDLLGTISISVELVLELGYDNTDSPHEILGSASVTVAVSVLMISKSFTLSVEKHFPIPGVAAAALATAAADEGRTGFRDLFPTVEEYARYWGAFA